MKDFFKGFLAFGLATSIQKLLGFVILPIYTRYFSPEEYGIIDMTGTVMAVATIFGLLQLETSLQRYYYEYNAIKRKLLVSNIYMLIVGCSIIVFIIIFFMAPFLSLKLFESSKYAVLIRLVSFQLPLNNLSMLGLVLLRFERENKKFLLVILTNVVSSLLFVSVFVVYLKLGLEGVFYAQLCAVFLSSGLVTYYMRNFFIFRWSLIMSKNNLNYALPQFPARIGSMILAQSNRFFMLGFLSLGAIGIYSVSMKLASSIQLVNTAFILAWAPFMHAQFKNKNNKIIFANVFPLVVGATFLCVCLIALFSEEMVSLLATAQFKTSYKYVGGLTLFFSLYIVKEIIDIGPKITQKTKYLSLNFFLSVIVNVASLYILIQYFQLEGVVLSMILTNLFLVGISWYVSNRLYYIAFSISKFLMLLLPALILAVVIMIVEISLINRILIALIIIPFYGLALKRYYKIFKSLQMKM